MKDTKAFIIETASDLFLQEGFNGVSMSDLVKKSGLTKGAFYHYFESKERLFRAVVENLLTLVPVKQNQDVSTMTLYQFYHNDVDNFIKTLPHYDAGDNRRYNFFMLFFDAVKIFPDMRNMISDLLQQQKSRWLTVIKKAKKAGEIKTNMKDENIAELFMTSSDGFGMYYILLHRDGIKKALLGLWDDLYASLK
jgi:AcrR family transcriptional regulator